MKCLCLAFLFLLFLGRSENFVTAQKLSADGHLRTTVLSIRLDIYFPRNSYLLIESGTKRSTVKPKLAQPSQNWLNCALLVSRFVTRNYLYGPCYCTCCYIFDATLACNVSQWLPSEIPLEKFLFQLKVKKIFVSPVEWICYLLFLLMRATELLELPFFCPSH